jgi:hypothetical protein
MSLANDSIILPSHNGSGLIIAIDCEAEDLKNSLTLHGVKETKTWGLLTNKINKQNLNQCRFSYILNFEGDINNTEEGVAFITAQTSLANTIILCIGRNVEHDRSINYALLCANLPASQRFIIIDENFYSISKYINIHCKPSETEWVESDGSSIACTLYGNIGTTNSGLHSAYLGKRAYERFIDSYYLDDFLKTAYIGYEPEKFYYILYFALVCFQNKKSNISFAELGATLWATIDKIDLCNSKLNCGYDNTNIEWNSIELSDYLRRLSHLLHKNLKLNFFDRWQNYHRSDVEIGFSHLVSPYAFHDIDSTINWVRKFRFCLWVNDFTLSSTFHLKVNGKRWTLLPLEYTLKALHDLGLDVYLVDAHNLDPEGQIKRASLVVIEKNSFSMDDYLSIVDTASEHCALNRNDFQFFNFEPADLWDEVIKDSNYLTKCAEVFSAGFAGALAITPTEPYEFRFSSSKLDEKIINYLGAIGVADEASKVRCP